MKKFLSNSGATLGVGIASGVTITRIIDGGNVIGAIAAGVVIGFILGMIVHAYVKNKK